MPATGLGPSSMGHPGLTGSQGGAGSLPGGPPGHLPGGPPGQGGGGGGGALPVSIPPQYSQSSYHPSYMQQVSYFKDPALKQDLFGKSSYPEFWMSSNLVSQLFKPAWRWFRNFEQLVQVGRIRWNVKNSFVLPSTMLLNSLSTQQCSQ